MPVLITAPAERLKERLLKRGREDCQRGGRAAAARPTPTIVDDARLVTIVNDGALDDAAEAFVRLLATTSALTRRPPPSLKRASTMNGRPGPG